jgi:hypothetical protein
MRLSKHHLYAIGVSTPRRPAGRPFALASLETLVVTSGAHVATPLLRLTYEAPGDQPTQKNLNVASRTLVSVSASDKSSNSFGSATATANGANMVKRSVATKPIRSKRLTTLPSGTRPTTPQSSRREPGPAWYVDQLTMVIQPTAAMSGVRVEHDPTSAPRERGVVVDIPVPAAERVRA